MRITCTKCGNNYDDGIHIENAKNVKLGNNSSICPKCGSKNSGQSGIFNFDKFGIATLISDTSFDSATLSELIKVLQAAKANHHSPEQITKAVAPISKKASSFLSKVITKDNLRLILEILLFLIYFKQEFLNNKDSTLDSFNTYLKSEKQKIEKEVERLEKEIVIKDSIIFSRSLSLNKPCPCGSGKKFKRCHGLKK